VTRASCVPAALAAIALLGCECGETRTVDAAVLPPPAVETTAAEPAAPPVCAIAILIAWQGAEGAASTVTLSEEDARARAEDLLAQLDVGADFGTLAATESDHAPSRARRGLVGTYHRGEWPAPFGELAERIERMGPFETSEVLRTSAGWAIVQRWPTELRHSRHILIRMAGAPGAGLAITRTREDALTSALELRRQILEGADFAELARTHSDDTETAGDGGDRGVLGRGRLPAVYESIEYQLAVGELSEPIETDEGFELIERLEDPAPPPP
jgi:peptidyl-prolyl cis-trans isomerase SurA